MKQNSEKTVIADHAKQEKLVPVLTYVYGLSRSRAVSATLSFLSMCHIDCSRNVRLSNVLIDEDEALCMSLLDEVIDTYIRVGNLPKNTQARLCKAVYDIMHKLHGENLDFLRNRFIAVCGEYSYDAYWKKIEQASCFKDVLHCMNTTLSPMQRKRLVDFSAVFIALAFLYGCGDGFYGRLALLEGKLKAKYANGFPFERLSLCLWPLDFSFVQDGEDALENCDEHLALLKAAQTINPDVKVQVCTGSLVWSRDIIAWLTDDYDWYAKSASRDVFSQFGRGALNEGGNIITGTAKDKFILVARGPLSDNEAAVDFYYEMFNRDVKVYTLPDGFLWSRDPETRKDFVLDSIHIDAVINVVPAWCTLDGRLKIIVDPYYYALIKNDSDFVRFLNEQRIPGADIIIVDERELYLNLPNFSVLSGPEGEKKLLFNKDLWHTIPRLNLKADVVVQPDIEITKMASCYGSIRCAIAMLPSEYVKDTCPLKINVSKKLSPEIIKTVLDPLHKDKRNAQALSKLWVSKINVLVGHEKNEWEFDEFSRTLHIALTPAWAADPETGGRAVDDLLSDFGHELSRRLGITLDVA
jgi:hypothetical protein